MKKIAVLLIGFVISVGQLRADEGMWPLIMIQQLQDSMQARGLKLTADDIYNINKACAKDAVVRLMSKQNRMFCTGEIISSEGLFLTNHHCGYGAIQELSTNEDNILANGFWAKNKGEERKANFNIGLLARVEDVTSKMLDSISLTMDESARAKAVADKLTKLQASLKEGLGVDKDNYVVEVVPFYAGNKFLAMYYMVYKDIRLVGTPPENIGKFGGETDNWMWPRHTADFSMFRIYANADNKPAEYNASNKPYAPLHFFPINIQGKNPEDFAMIMGYPGRTQRYTYSKGIQYYSSKERPMRVKVRRDVLDVYEEFMHADPKIKLMYADKFASLSNYWKKFMGEASALPQQHLYEKRKAEEDKLKAWIAANNKGAVYNEMFDLYDQGYAQIEKYGMYGVYMQDGISNSQPMGFAMGLSKLEALLKDKSKPEEAKKAAAEMSKELDEQYKEYFDPIEVKVLATVLMHLTEDLDHANLPKELVDLSVKYNKDYSKMATELYAKSFLTSKEKMTAFLANPSLKKMNKDMIYVITSAYINKMNEMRPITMDINNKIGRANRLFQAAMLEMDGKKLYSPDANGTMRLTYGRVLPYNAKDAVSYKEFTTSKGILEKYTPGDIEFDAPKKLVNMLKAKDFGQYADKDGELHACFLTDNDITGGNSGSPVINGRGELIGTAFDGNWEAIASDFGFDANLQRTISLDIRYTLFIMDKFGGAGYLLNEMKIVKDEPIKPIEKAEVKPEVKPVVIPKDMQVPTGYNVLDGQLIKDDFNKDGAMDYIGLIQKESKDNITEYYVIVGLSQGVEKSLLLEDIQVSSSIPTIEAIGDGKFKITSSDEYLNLTLNIKFDKSINDFLFNDFDVDYHYRDYTQALSINLVYKGGKYTSKVVDSENHKKYNRIFSKKITFANSEEFLKLIKH